MSNGSESEAWTRLTTPLGLTDATVGQEVRSSSDGPALSGKVEIAGYGEGPETMLLVDEPGRGVCHVSAMSMGEQIYVSIRFYLFGDGAAESVAKAEPEWSQWFAERFPMGG